MGILAGQVYGDSNSSGWNLHQGSGDRYFDQTISFQAPFPASPLVQASLNKVDAEGQPNLRVEILVANISNIGFTLRIHTWADTKLHSIRANWLAFTP
jgi:hypothetical protein